MHALYQQGRAESAAAKLELADAGHLSCSSSSPFQRAQWNQPKREGSKEEEAEEKEKEEKETISRLAYCRATQYARKPLEQDASERAGRPAPVGHQRIALGRAGTLTTGRRAGRLKARAQIQRG